MKYQSSSARSKVFLNIERFEIGQSYVTAKVRIDTATKLILTYKVAGLE
jgi:hypothetical protein